MSDTSLPAVIQQLYSAPLIAVTTAEKEYRKIWARWLKAKLELIPRDANKAPMIQDLNAFLSSAPVVTMEGVIEMALTMRIASVTEKSGGLEGGLKVGPVYATGRYGSSSKTTQESLFQASTRVVISNHAANLSEFLAQNQHISPKSPADLDTLITTLDK